VKVLLTGATGFLGKNVARCLAGAGHELRLLAREGSRLDGLPPAEIARGDVTDRDSLLRAAEGQQAVVHLAALVKTWVPDRSRFDAVNVQGLRNVLEASRQAGARLVYTSSFIAVGPAGPEPADESRVHPGQGHRNDYERSKAQADVLARAAAEAGQEIVLLYPGVIYGPGERTEGNIVVKLILDHARGRVPAILGPGDRLWSYAYVEDVAEGHRAALERGRSGQRYFLAGENVDMNGLFARLQEATGLRPPRFHLPYAAASALGWAMLAWAELTGHPPQLTHREVAVFREHWAYSSAKAERELGYRPRPLREGLRATVDWLRESGLLLGEQGGAAAHPLEPPPGRRK
jgi:NAD+-dependent farnesol dehydrogenase